MANEIEVAGFAEDGDVGVAHAIEHRGFNHSVVNHVLEDQSGAGLIAVAGLL